MSRTAGDLEVQFLRKEFLKLRQEIALRPIGGPLKSSFSYPPYVQIIGGQTVSAVPMIQYAADPFTSTGYYDPTVDTSYQVGLGYGTLYNLNGQASQKVLIRHNYTGFTDPVMGGVTYIVGNAISIPVNATNAPPGSPVTGQKYTVGSSGSGAWAGHNGATATWSGSSWSFSAAPSSLVMSVYPLIRG